MALFKKSGFKAPSRVKEKVARTIADRIIKAQAGAAKWLHHWQQKSSARKRNITLAVCALLWFSYCIYLVIAAIVG